MSDAPKDPTDTANPPPSQGFRALPRQSQMFFLLILLGMAVLLWSVFKPFVILMVAGVFVAVLSLPIDRFWERALGYTRVKEGRWKPIANRLAAVATMLTLAVILIIPILGIGWALQGDMVDLIEDLQAGKADVWVNAALTSPTGERILEAMYPENTTQDRQVLAVQTINNGINETVLYLVKFVANMAQKVPDFLLGMTVILFVVYYVLIDGDRLVSYVRRAAPLPVRQVDFIFKEAHNGLRAVFTGQILTSLIQGTLGGIGFIIAGVPGAILWAAVMAVLSLLPVVGAFLVWVPAVIWLFAVGKVVQAIILLIWGVVVVSQVDNFIRPKLIGDRASIHPIFVLIGVLGGIAAFGFIGLFLGPLIVGVTISILKVWEDQYLDPVVGRDDPSRPKKAKPDS